MADTADRKPDTGVNRKEAAARLKVPMHLVPPAAIVALAIAMEVGAEKYGPFNFRAAPVVSSVYYSATMRHLAAWYDGEDVDPDSGVSHLALAMSGLAILVDAGTSLNLKDDRPEPGHAADALRSFYQDK